MNYRAEIDGLRAIAVVSVMLYHAQIIIFGRDWFKGGFIGVDIFFVVSGYLITRIILTELEKTNRFNFVKFYERRARRILPMLLLVIAVCIPFAWQRMLPLDLVDFAKSALSAIGFGSNFFFYFSTTEYGAESALIKPLLHTWSLGVEEQFYIVVPIIILLIWKFARTSLLTVLIGMLLMSIQFADVMEGRNSELNFFLPFSRFWELFVGSALAFVELKYGRIKNSLVTQTLPIVGLFLIVHSVFFFDSNTPHPSFETFMPIVGVALVLAFCSTDDVVGKLLSLKPIVGVGFISYSLYLWHFPIFAFSRIGSSNLSNYDKLECIAATVILSVLSYFLVEKIFRNSNLISKKSFYLIIIIAVCCLFYVNYKFISNNGYKDRFPPILSKQNLDEPVWKNFKQNNKMCYGRETDFCSIDNEESLTRIYAFGDSHLSAMSPQLISALDKNFNYTEANIGGCIFVLYTNRYQTKTNKAHPCDEAFNQKRYELIKESSSIILVGGRFAQALFDGHGFDNKEGGFEGKKYIGFKSSNNLSLKENINITLQKLISGEHQVVLIYPIPEVGTAVPKYIYEKIKKIDNLNDSTKINELMTSESLTTSYEVYKERSASTFKLFDSIQSPNIHRVYPHTLFCDNQIKGRCVTHNNDDVFYADDDHPSAKGSEMIVELIMEQIVAAEANIRQN